jgi:hypothetical protein
MYRIVQRVPALLLLSATVFLLVGCGFRSAAQRMKRSNQLKLIGLAYHDYYDSFAKGPSGPEDLKNYMEGGNDAHQALVNGDFVVIWNVRIPEMVGGTGSTVLGYEKDVPSKGGLVLMGDASVQQMSADEFKNAPKATPKKP